ncbi:MAG: NYN domain-containing protein [Austwickia sp.]|jgi:uncharacterized protein|nr:MAG: NYN domain-containing protein [Austwickia sp.]
MSEPTQQAGREPITYVLVDGENIDATLGLSILERRPDRDERPRWDRVLTFAERRWEQPVRGLFFIAIHEGFDMPFAFVQAMRSIGFRPIPVTGRRDQKVVDIAIKRTLGAIAERSGDVMLASHDGDFLPELQALMDGRRIGVLGFNEFRNVGYADLADDIELFDLEFDVGAFTQPLPRLRVIPIDEFDPVPFL